MRFFAAALPLILSLVCGCGRSPGKPATEITLAEAGPKVAPAPALPPHSVVVNLSQAAIIAAPFTLASDPRAVSGMCLILAEGAGSASHSGRASFDIEASVAGNYVAWAHVLWRDSCANSLALTIAGSPERIAGEDHIYGTWHWVRCGSWVLKRGTHAITVREREDGIRIDQFLLVPDETFTPSGVVGGDTAQVEVRRFADDFSRSPGHGMEAWDLRAGDWSIAFSFDPNRIPNQYALEGKAAGGRAIAMVKGPTWRGCRIEVDILPEKGSRAGVVLDDGGGDPLLIELIPGPGGSLQVSGRGLSLDPDADVRPGQWHHLTVERWAWTLSVSVDGGKPMIVRNLRIGAESVGLVVKGGKAVFDNLAVDQIMWHADDGNDERLSWISGQDASWTRPIAVKAGDPAMIGYRGAATFPLDGRWLAEARLEFADEASKARCRFEIVQKDGTTKDVPYTGTDETVLQAVFARSSPEAEAPAAIRLVAETGEVRLKRVALRYSLSRPDNYVIGPYHFTSNTIIDPGDYLDFSAHEHEEMLSAPEASKFRRVPRHMNIIGRGDKCAWHIQTGRWSIARGLLNGAGANATLRHDREVVGDLELDLKIALKSAHSAAEIELYAGPEPGVRILVLGPKADVSDAGENVLRLTAAALDSAPEQLSVRVSGGRLQARLGAKGAGKGLDFHRGIGGRILLKIVTGSATFDDIEIRIPRHTASGSYHAFDRPETDWWREGGPWLDHGGIACAIASSWISLTAAQGDGYLHYKRPVPDDVMVSVGVEENSEWYGWNANPSHQHFPADNVTLVLAGTDGPQSGYRLVVNSGSPRSTILYRNGKEVARRSQEDLTFPIRYAGGHAPYSPRRNRVGLVKRGGVLQALVNGVDVLRFEDPEPLPLGGVAVGGTRTRVNFSDLEVRRLGRQ